MPRPRHRQVLAVMPGAAVAHSNLGNVPEELERFIEADAHVRLVAMLDPNLSEAHCNLASLALHAGGLDEVEPDRMASSRRTG